MNLKISIIIPVFNAEKHLERCLNSISVQTFQNLEILLINDGSTDTSGEICDRFSHLDKRFIVIHKKNEGTSSARNQGLKFATGDYVGFIDSDDNIRPEMYEKMLVCAIKEKLNLVVCEYENSVGSIFKLRMNKGGNKVLKDDYLAGMKYIPHGVFNVWNKLFSAELAKSKSFIHGKIHQDALYISEILLEVAELGVINEPLYIYNVENESVTRSKYNSTRLAGIEVVLEAQKNLISAVSSERALEGIRVWFLEFLFGHYASLSIHPGLDKDNIIREKLLGLIRIHNSKKDNNIRFYLANYLPFSLYGVIYFCYIKISKLKMQTFIK
ncbi:glycosyltransferase [Flavobacteriaceae bacterium KMM 6898]|nr:glycosyltransferase [Flavobacteriaceae bacterium KMM 6898]